MNTHYYTFIHNRSIPTNNLYLHQQNAIKTPFRFSYKFKKITQFLFDADFFLSRLFFVFLCFRFTGSLDAASILFFLVSCKYTMNK